MSRGPRASQGRPGAFLLRTNSGSEGLMTAAIHPSRRKPIKEGINLRGAVMESADDDGRGLLGAGLDLADLADVDLQARALELQDMLRQELGEPISPPSPWPPRT